MCHPRIVISGSRSQNWWPVDRKSAKIDHFREHEYVPLSLKGWGWGFLAEVPTRTPNLALFADFAEKGDKIGTYTACSRVKVVGDHFWSDPLAVGPDFDRKIVKKHRF